MALTHASTVYIDYAAYRHNLEVVRQLIGTSARIMAVVKADAYGHGLVQIAEHAIRWGVKMLGVATVDEGVQLRAAGVKAPIVVLMQPPRDALAASVEYGLTVMLSDLEAATALGEIAHEMSRVVSVHCKIDTGMGRQGFRQSTAAQEIQYLTRISNIDIEGLATHFPTANKPEDPFTYGQIKSFRQILRQLEREGIPFEMAHAANSAGIVNYRSSIFDLVRAGIMTYGVWPSDETEDASLLQPVMQWESTVTQVREFEAGASVGYGRTYTTPDRARIALVPVGYGDGYPYALSNKSEVLIHGTRCPIRGSVCMDQIAVDTTHLESVQNGDVCVLLGKQMREVIRAEELARLAGTIPYEILSGVGTRVARVYRN